MTKCTLLQTAKHCFNKFTGQSSKSWLAECRVYFIRQLHLPSVHLSSLFVTVICHIQVQGIVIYKDSATLHPLAATLNNCIKVLRILWKLYHFLEIYRNIISSYMDTYTLSDGTLTDYKDELEVVRLSHCPYQRPSVMNEQMGRFLLHQNTKLSRRDILVEIGDYCPFAGHFGRVSLRLGWAQPLSAARNSYTPYGYALYFLLNTHY